MNKIDFKNLPDTTTPLNASNLNTMQDNIETAIDSTISNTSGTSQTIGYSQEYINNLNKYSTSEEIPVGTWIDGKTIYRKVFTQTNLTNSPYSLDISSANYDNIVKMDGLVNIGNDSGLLSTWYSSSYNIATTIKRNTKKIDIAWSGWASLSSIIIVLEYTKAN